MPEDAPQDQGRIEFIEITGLSVAQFVPESDGEATQVHMIIRINGFDRPLVMRFHTGDVIDELVSALMDHRREVFGW